jgi:hypothetical protein
MTRTEPAGEPFRVADGERVVTAQKVFTRMGERLDLRSEGLGERTSLDAIMLESVAWQDPEEMAERAAGVDRSDAQTAPELEGTERDEPITVSSEFAQARVRKVGDELEIAAPKLGYDVRLGPGELAWLTLQDHETFTSWLETPFGPGADEHDH